MAARVFDLLEHPTDIGFRAYGATEAELFANCAVAMLSIADEPAAAEPRKEYRISVESGDRESLLVDWLNEVLYWFDGRRIAFHDFEVTRYGANTVEAVGRGEPRDAERHRARLIVKAVTYHQLRIARHDSGWMAEVYLDI